MEEKEADFETKHAAFLKHVADERKMVTTTSKGKVVDLGKLSEEVIKEVDAIVLKAKAETKTLKAVRLEVKGGVAKMQRVVSAAVQQLSKMMRASNALSVKQVKGVVRSQEKDIKGVAKSLKNDVRAIRRTAQRARAQTKVHGAALLLREHLLAEPDPLLFSLPV